MILEQKYSATLNELMDKDKQIQKNYELIEDKDRQISKMKTIAQ